jgi:DNA-binding MltR family transcriptional regulator
VIEISEAVRRHWRVIKELEGQSDRGVAIVGAAYLEERLAEAIRSRFVSSASSQVTKKLFEGYGPLTTLNAKIDIAHSLGLLGIHSLQDAHSIRKIRNEFAHTADPLGFNDLAIATKCADLWLPANILWFGATTPPQEPRDQYITATVMLWNLIQSEMGQNKTVLEPARIVP